MGDVAQCYSRYEIIAEWTSIIGTREWQQGYVAHGHIDPDSKVHGANMGPIWDRQDPGGPHVGPANFPIWGVPTDVD